MLGAALGSYALNIAEHFSKAPKAFGNIWKHMERQLERQSIERQLERQFNAMISGFQLMFYSAVLVDQSVVSSPNRSYNRRPGITPGKAERNRKGMFIGNPNVFANVFLTWYFGLFIFLCVLTMFDHFWPTYFFSLLWLRADSGRAWDFRRPTFERIRVSLGP